MTAVLGATPLRSSTCVICGEPIAVGQPRNADNEHLSCYNEAMQEMYDTLRREQ